MKITSYPLLGAVCGLLLLSNCQKQKDIQVKAYPETKKVDQVDTYFGTDIKDPYRWLEDDNSEETKAWVDAQNEVTFDYLNQISSRETIKERLTEIYNYPKYSAPFRVGKYYFFNKNDGLQNQSITYIREGLDGEPKVFLDPNSMSDDGTVSAGISGVSKDDKYVTIAVNRSGSDWQEFYVREVATGKELDDQINWAKFSGTSWYKDGFFYSSYGIPEEGEALSGKNEYHKVYYHKLGTDQQEDLLYYEDTEHPLRNFGSYVTEDEKYLIIRGSEGTSGSELYYIDLEAKSKKPTLLFKGFDFEYSVLDHKNGMFLVLTNHDAPNYKLVAVNLEKPAIDEWRTIIPEKDELLVSTNLAGGKIFSRYLKDVTHRVYQHDLTGKIEREINLPDLGSVSGFGGEDEDTEVFYTFSSYVYPPTIFKYNIEDGTSEEYIKTEVKVDYTQYETKQVFYTSKDGTQVPMFIVKKKDTPLDGKRPVYLYAYGGFNISLTPGFSISNFILLENGGIFAQPSLRGGGEYGEEWHKAGMLLNKQNVFDDFIAAAEYLIDNNYTDKDHLAIAGGSNGGLLVGATMTQRPDLFKVCFPAVGVLDMLRYEQFTIGWAWAVEYGTVKEEEHFKNLLGYSPLHNVKDTAYPATMITTADHDDRVVPAHSFKFAATLQEHQQGDAPVLIRIEKKAGHGAGKPISKIIEEQADKWSFMFYNMGVSLQ